MTGILKCQRFLMTQAGHKKNSMDILPIKTLTFLLLMVTMSLTGCMSDENKLPIETGQRPITMSRTVKVEMDYLFYLPEGYGKDDKPWPLMIFLHGADERGSDLERVKMHGPSKMVSQNRNLPFIIASPQCPKDKWWPNLTVNVIAMIDDITENYNVDRSRIYLTGLSMGGYGTWTIACAYPDRFAAIVPICGGGRPFVAANLKDVPVWAFHGEKDDVVPLGESQKMTAAVKRAGGSAKLTIYPEAGHDSWTETYNNEELYKWLLSHRKNK